MSLKGLNPKCWQGLFFLDVPGQICSLTLPDSRDCCIPGHITPSSAFAGILPSLSIAFCLPVTRSLCYIRTHQEDSLPISRSLTYPNLQCPFLPYYITYVQILGIRTWSSSEDQFSSLPQLHYGILSMT